MHVVTMLREGGVGAYAAVALGALGLLLGVVAVIAFLSRSASAFLLGLATLVVGLGAAGAGVAGALHGQRQTRLAAASIDSSVTAERVLQAGDAEARNAALVGFAASGLPVVLGALAALAGARLARTPSRVQGHGERASSADAGAAPTVVAVTFTLMALLAWAGAGLVGFGRPPSTRYRFATDDHDAWGLAAALEEVERDTPSACDRLHEALTRFWEPSHPRQWPRRMRHEVPPELSQWRAAADGCAERVLTSLDQPAANPTAWTRDGLLDSPLLQDDTLRARALAWSPASAAVDGDEEDVTGTLARELLAATVRRALPRVRHCYERALTKNPTLAGKLLVSFAITSRGAVEEVAEANDEGPAFPDAEVTACVVAVVASLRFPAPTGGAVVVRYPFVFTPAR